ncbi:MAG TPA: alkaline phosphatase [Thermoanaerobaculia bacterium]|nr:alkaline phosphatase [Thermoanaerobaculia bacterium]
MNRSIIPLLLVFLLPSACRTADLDRPDAISPPPVESPAIDDASYARAAAAVAARAAELPLERRAKNVILFVGDGMGVSTVSAARILEGQMRGETGEENFLAFERFPFIALAKTWTTDSQVPDSAGTMSAMMTGVKTYSGAIAVSDDARDDPFDSGHALPTLLEIAENRGMATGIISTARVTHATPAATYAHIANRDWEVDSARSPEAAQAGVVDIARQLLQPAAGDGPEVVFGGGRSFFLPETEADPEYPETRGRRTDGIDLTAEWSRRPGSRYVWNQAQFDALGPGERVLGLFEPSHMQFEHDRPRDGAGEPSLGAMVAKALDLLSGDPDGFFLMVEGGRIDHAHHGGNAYRALTDTVEFARAVQTAIDRVDRTETLVLVTADHSHVFTIAGYPRRGNPIFGKVIDTGGNLAKDRDGLPYTTLGYQNGPGARAERPDLTEVDTTASSYLQEAAVPTRSETHSGEDVAVYAIGPGADLVRGVIEQNEIFHILLHAIEQGRPHR